MEFKDLIGKTITEVEHLTLKEYDDEGFLVLRFSDGSGAFIEGGYGGYTGLSEDEYITLINIDDLEEIDLSGFEALTPTE